MEVDFLRGSKLINLRYNAFTRFDISTLDNELSDTFSTFFLRVQLNFGEFVFNCDCRMYSLYQFMNSADIFNQTQPFRFYLTRLPIYHNMQNNFNYNINGFRCLRPIEFRGQPLLQVPITAFGCDEKLSTCPPNCRCWVRTVDQAVKWNVPIKLSLGCPILFRMEVSSWLYQITSLESYRMCQIMCVFFKFWIWAEIICTSWTRIFLKHNTT